MSTLKEKKLIDILYDQLNESGNFERVTKGRFEDKSASWIDCFNSIEPNANNKRLSKELSFNGKGTVLENIQIWEEKMEWGSPTEVK